jgi:hypothetical protein
VVPGDGTDVWGKIHMNRGRVGEERRGKEMDRYPLTEFSIALMGHEFSYQQDYVDENR